LPGDDYRRRVLTAADLRAGVPSPQVSLSGEVTSVMHLLDLDQPVPDVEAARRVLAERTSLVVGVAHGPLTRAAAAVAEALDLTLVERPDAGSSRLTVESAAHAIEQLQEAVDRSPRSALVLGALLRQTSQLPVAEALAAEAAAYSTLLAGPEFARWLTERGPARPARTDDLPRVDCRRDGDVLHVRMTRVVRRNAFDAAMRAALSEALEVALLDPDVDVLLTGEGPVFSAGGDLDEFGSAADPATAWVVRVGDSPAHALARLRDRAQAEVHGACAGAGVELPAFAGRVIARPGTTFRLPELAMGLLPGAGGTVSLPRRIGRWRTAWLGLTGETIDAELALAWGLVDVVE
jgi:enoyl-CoA hydratase/carnithine racemase